jgi:2,4-dienoyl-CoA reductase-like NADH-dependent reductase (Old Yellow Enzyme family)
LNRPIAFSPFKIGDLTLKNRFVISPMGQYCTVGGVVDDWHLVHLGRFALGGAALAMVEATSVEARGRITPGDPGLHAAEEVLAAGSADLVAMRRHLQA